MKYMNKIIPIPSASIARALLCWILLSTTAAGVAQAEPALRDFPYWRSMEGWWRAENTYFDGALNYNERSYSSLVRVELVGRRYRETEYKFYPAGKLAQQAGRGQLPADAGIETVTILEGDLVDATGSVRLLGAPGTSIQMLSADTGVRVTANPASGVDTYRMFIFAVAPDKRYRSNFGIVSDTQGAGAANALPGAALGDLRGFSLFREDRIAPAEFDAWRQRFRIRHGVRAIAEAGREGIVEIRRLD
jgi:hypothetical protein